MKKIFDFIMMALLVLMINGCGAGREQEGIGAFSDSNAVQETKTLLDAEFKKHYNELSIDGSEIELPCDYTEFMDIGFEADDKRLKVEKGVPQPVSLKKDDSCITIYVAYDGEDSVALCEDSKVISVLVSRDDSKTLNPEFYKGINFESREEDVSKVLDFVQSEGEDSLYAIKMGDYSYLSVSFLDGKVHDIMVINGEGYFN